MTAESNSEKTLFNTGTITASDIASAVDFAGGIPFSLHDWYLLV
jgi:hypothetical protein